jgi:hypothetical protein
MEYNKNFSLFDAYDFLNANGLEQECEEIKNSSDKFKSYSSTLRRAKIITLVRDKKLLDEFCKAVWPSGHTEKGKSRIKFFENLVVRFYNDQDGTGYRARIRNHGHSCSCVKLLSAHIPHTYEPEHKV